MTRFRGDRGSATGIVLGVLPGLLIAAALVVDGGRQIETRRDVRGAAAVAARAGAQLSPDELIAGRLDPTLAADRAVNAAGAAGYAVAVDVSDTTVTVTASGTVEFVMLDLVGVNRRTVTATVTATALVGVTDGTPL